MKGRPRGFTLIELLIALALITLALSIAFSALRLGMRALERTDQVAGELEALRIASSVMQRHLAQARPLRESASESQLNFRGETQLLEFVAPAPLQNERIAGLYHYRLRFEHHQGGGQLLLDYQPYRPGTPRLWSPGHETALLLEQLDAGEFSYFNSRDERGVWLSRWSEQERLPDLVRVSLTRSGNDHEQLEMVVRLPAEKGR